MQTVFVILYRLTTFNGTARSVSNNVLKMILMSNVNALLGFMRPVWTSNKLAGKRSLSVRETCLAWTWFKDQTDCPNPLKVFISRGIYQLYQINYEQRRVGIAVVGTDW